MNVSIAWSWQWSSIVVWLLAGALVGAYVALYLHTHPEPEVEPDLARLERGLMEGERHVHR